MMFASTPGAIAALEVAAAEAKQKFIPPPELTVSEWADQRRRLSRIDSAEPGPWVTATAEYQRGPMDAFTDPAVEDIVLMTAAQCGKTSIALNILGYIISAKIASPRA